MTSSTSLRRIFSLVPIRKRMGTNVEELGSSRSPAKSGAASASQAESRPQSGLSGWTLTSLAASWLLIGLGACNNGTSDAVSEDSDSGATLDAAASDEEDETGNNDDTDRAEAPGASEEPESSEEGSSSVDAGDDSEGTDADNDDEEPADAGTADASSSGQDRADASTDMTNDEPTSGDAAVDSGADAASPDGGSIQDQVQDIVNSLVPCEGDDECAADCPENASCICGNLRGGMGGGGQGVCRVECESDEDCDGTTCTMNGVCSLLGGNQFQGADGGFNNGNGPGNRN